MAHMYLHARWAGCIRGRASRLANSLGWTPTLFADIDIGHRGHKAVLVVRVQKDSSSGAQPPAAMHCPPSTAQPPSCHCAGTAGTGHSCRPQHLGSFPDPGTGFVLPNTEGRPLQGQTLQGLHCWILDCLLVPVGASRRSTPAGPARPGSV
jgi:hypothetical protein